MLGTSPPDNRKQSAPGPRPSPPMRPGIAAPARNPARYKRIIPDLREGEDVVLLQRRHPATLFGGLVWPILLLVVWLAILLFAGPSLSGLQPDPFTQTEGGIAAWLPTLLWFVWLGVAAALVIWAAYLVLDWSDDWIALTTKRVIIMEKALFFRETRREAPVSRVQNVTAEYPSSAGVALDYGDLRIDTSGTGVLLFKNLSRPKAMREAIFSLHEEMRANQPSQEDRRKAAVRSILGGADPTRHDAPTPPEGNSVMAPRGGQPAANSGQGTLHSLFPFSPRREGEKVTWHRHWIYLLRVLFPPIFIWTLAVAGWFASILLGEGGQFNTVAMVLGWIVVVLSPLCLGWALWNWEDWRNDLYVIDRERVYDIERLPFGLREQSKQTLITRITDVTYVVPGLLAHLLNFGHVVLKTPGEATEFTFTGVPCPREVQQEIMERVEEYRTKGSAGTDQEIEAWLRAYHSVREEGVAG